jgi:hypothetical protein
VRWFSFSKHFPRGMTAAPPRCSGSLACRS